MINATAARVLALMISAQMGGFTETFDHDDMPWDAKSIDLLPSQFISLLIPLKILTLGHRANVTLDCLARNSIKQG